MKYLAILCMIFTQFCGHLEASDGKYTVDKGGVVTVGKPIKK